MGVAAKSPNDGYTLVVGTTETEEPSGGHLGDLDKQSKGAIARAMKAKDADVYIHTREPATEYPDYDSTDAGLKCLYTGTGTVQEVFLICSDAEGAKAWLASAGITATDEA